MARRIQGVSVTGEMIAAAFPEGKLPSTAKFSHAYFDSARSVFICVFEDDSFERLPEGCTLPIDVNDTVMRSWHVFDKIDCKR